MKPFILILLLVLPIAGRSLWAQAESLLPADSPREVQRVPPRGVLSEEERQRRRAEGLNRHEQHEERRAAWQQMSPEERQRLRSDIRDAGRVIYPRRGRQQQN
jgi:hypothetical protein